MCGIIFSYSFNLDYIDRARRALDKLKHRGPDAQNLCIDHNVCIGHARLSIVDLSTSHQPMHSNDKRYWLTFNGEIYNFKELREKLKHSWNFTTQGDTEVLLAGLITLRESFINELEGMWAFAFWDRADKKLLLCRDRTGKKPLYYRTKKVSFLCASELPALKLLDHEKWEEDHDCTADYFRYGVYLPGYTAYKNVFEVPPGHIINWNSRTGVQKIQYWKIDRTPWHKSKAESAGLLRELFSNSVEKRLIADVEIGAFLSGGVDSSIIANQMSRLKKGRIKTFTVKFMHSGYDESTFAKQVAENISTIHYESQFQDISHYNIQNLIENNIGQPYSDLSILPTYLLCESTATQVKVALSGDGGDELFSGYQRYQARVMFNWYSRLPHSVQRSTEKLLSYLPDPDTHHSRSLIKKAKLFIHLAKEHKLGNIYIAPSMIKTSTLKELCPGLVSMGKKPDELFLESSPQDYSDMMYRDMLVYLPQDIHIKVDRASMAHGLEVRSPFLDTKIIDFSFSIPQDWHRSLIGGKKFLRHALGELAPKNIWNRRKQGFSVPASSWFKQSLSDDLLQMLETNKSPLNRNALQNLIEIHRKGREDYSLQLWTIYTYLLAMQNM